MAFENVVKVNYNNHTYELNGVSVDTFLESVQFNRATSDLVVDGDTLRIQPKTGTKGADSSVITRYFWDAEKGLTLEFVSGKVYLYPDVTKEQFDALEAAESKGKYFNENLKSLKYEKL